MHLNHVIRIKQLFIFVENLLIAGFGQLRILIIDLVRQISYLGQIKVLCRRIQTEHWMCLVSHFMRFKGGLKIFEIVVWKLILGEVYLISLLRY